MARHRRRLASLSVVLLVVLCGLAPVESATVELRYETSPGLEGLSEQLAEMDPESLDRVVRLVGLENPGGPIRVVLADERTEAARSAPRWVSGYALSRESVVVLLPERILSYPHGSLEEVLRHELAHVLIARAAGQRPVPRWLNEGLAMIAGSAWGFGDRSRVAMALILNRERPLAEIDRLFRESPSEVKDAYALAGAFTHDLLQRHGPDTAADLLELMSSGRAFGQAFREVTGRSVAEAESSFWRRYSIWYRWVPLLTSSTTLWMAITVLALLAFRRRRARDRLLRERWLAEELFEEPGEGAQ
ncbi:MAG: hypothetical protein VYE73_00725 [Acidobacteriota bacterium]|nr:hypothetical protein [Acidobacteriota bacterium]